MSNNYCVRLFFTAFFASACCSAQTTPAQPSSELPPCIKISSHGPSQKDSTTGGAKLGDASYRHLSRVQTVQSPSEVATQLLDLVTCDGEGNIYVMTDPTTLAIHKLNSKGERTALFEPVSNADLKIDFGAYFTPQPDGQLYQLVFPHEITRYVFVYGSDGSLKFTIKLQPGFAWAPSVIAVFPSGQLLISGSEYDHDKTAAMWPFTGIFDGDGRLLKEIKLEDDDTLHDMAASGDARVTTPGNSQSNLAISFSKVEMGSDGNAYLMRWTTPAIFYAISPGGEIVRRFKVDPGAANYLPTQMHISQGRVAVLFVNRENMHTIMKIVDLEGHEVATYVEPMAGGKPTGDMRSTVFACYTQNPERFTFIGTSDDSRLQFWIGEPR